MTDRAAVATAMTAALFLFLSAIAAVYAFGPEDPSYCDFYPATCEYNRQVGR